MRRFLLYATLLLLLAGWFAPQPAAAAQGVIILCYHDVGKINNEWTVTRDALEGHFKYLEQNGYHPISLQQYIDANEGKGTLPDKPVLITFDDGYISFYTEVFPLLQQYRFPAMLAVVTTWQTAYKPPDVGPLVNWQQMREMEQSGLVAIASHSHDLHHGVTASPYGDRGEPASTLAYRSNETYETLEQYQVKIAADLAETQRVFERELGHRAAAMVWPYGEYTLFGVDIAKQLGFKVFMTLGGGFNPIGETSLLEARRGIIVNNPSVQKFAQFLQAAGDDNKPLRAAWLDIEHVRGPANIQQTDLNTRAVTERYLRLGLNHVFLEAFRTVDVDGGRGEAQFYTKGGPLKGLLFDHVARKFRDEGIFVYAVVPTALVLTAPEACRDLAAYSFLDGVVFQDDLVLPATKPTAGQSRDLTEALQRSMEEIRKYKPYAKFIRAVRLDPAVPVGEQVVPSPIDHSVKLHQYTLFLPPAAMQAGTVQQLSARAEEIMLRPGAAETSIFAIATFDADKKRWRSDSEVKDYLQALKAKGVRYFAFYPDAMFSEKSGVLTF